jgi:uncharacterized protein YyaL (SSP411 family)
MRLAMRSPLRFVFLIALVPSLVAAGCASSQPTAADSTAPATAPTAAATAKSNAVIAWNEWAPEPFERAAQTGKLVVVDVGMEGCTACRWMDEDTYRHPEVVALIDQHFVAIQVDGEANPDVGERYSDWAWPATIFIAPDGTQVLALRGNKRPRNFLPILRGLIEQQRAGTLTPDAAAPLVTPDEPVDAELQAVRDRVVGQLDRAWSEKTSDWSGNAPVVQTTPEPIEHAFARAHLGDVVWRQRALAALEGRAKLIDPVWGGLFIAGFAEDPATEFIPEKRTAQEAGALAGFANAYRLTGDDVWLERARQIDRYLRGPLYASDGTFFTSQEDDAPDLPRGMDARSYYLLDSDDARRRYGTPPVDHAVYTDLNALVIRAYLQLYEATAQREYLDVATRAADALLAERAQPDGWLLHVTERDTVGDDARMRALALAPRVYLRPNAHFGLALVDLYGATSNKGYLQAATRVADALLAQLADAKAGGFFSGPASGTESITPRRKPVEDNAVAARLLSLLGAQTRDDKYTAAAERTVRAISHEASVRREGRLVGNLALALDLMLSGPLEFTVVGSADDPRARALFAASTRVYEPRKAQHYEAPGRYPDRGQPSLFICNDQACSAPITDPERVAEQAARFVPAAARVPPK